MFGDFDKKGSTLGKVNPLWVRVSASHPPLYGVTHEDPEWSASGMSRIIDQVDYPIVSWPWIECGLWIEYQEWYILTAVAWITNWLRHYVCCNRALFDKGIGRSFPHEGLGCPVACGRCGCGVPLLPYVPVSRRLCLLGRCPIRCPLSWLLLVVIIKCRQSTLTGISCLTYRTRYTIIGIWMREDRTTHGSDYRTQAPNQIQIS